MGYQFNPFTGNLDLVGSGGGGNPFNQSLNTTDVVAFESVTAQTLSADVGGFGMYLDCASLRIGGVTVDWSIYATLTDTQTLSNKTLAAPRISNGSTTAILSADAANVLSVANSNVSGCGLRIFNTRTDASNFERGVFDWTVLANTLTIGTMKGGTGASRDVRIRSTNNVDIFALDTTQAASFRSGVTILYTPLQFVPTTKAGAATTADLSSGRAGLFKNSTDGSVRLWMNDGGVMKSVALT